MLISELAKAVHENAVEHGWWDEDREAPEVGALIHSEWSEALEEARAGRPLAYIEAFTGSQRDPVTSIIPRNVEGKYIAPWGDEYHGKPEGVAVELIDGCIRILDYMGTAEIHATDNDDAELGFEYLYSGEVVDMIPDKIPELIACLHKYTSEAIFNDNSRFNHILEPYALFASMAAALSWVKKQGLDPLAILLEKHEYNKTRPYKHGKKF